MKMKKFFSGIFAAVMSIAVITAPLSTANADDPPADEKCIITINHAASTGTYTAYPIFVGDVEMETNDEEKSTGRKLISSPTFHENLNTKINSGTVAEKSGTDKYGLYEYLEKDTQINSVGFLGMIKAYDPKTSFSNFSIKATGVAASSQAETLANILNLTSSDEYAVTGNNGILGGARTSAFYSAFAEAARMFMVDKITTKSIKEGDSEATSDAKALTDTVTGTYSTTTKQVTIEVTKPGYYLVEYMPAGDSTDYENIPKKVRRSLVLVGKGTELSATINSKDTENIASVDVQFYDITGTKETVTEGEESKEVYTFPEKIEKDKLDEDGKVITNTETGKAEKETVREGKWAKNVSAGNGDYVNCRIVVTLPGNLMDYDQYYLAVPIMYGYYSTSSNTFDFKNKSIKRQGSDKENVKVYFLNGENKISINEDSFTIPTSYDYADDKDKPTGGVDADKFVATETFVFTDIANIDVRAKDATDALLAKNSGYNKLVIEFPVKFERFPSDVTTFNATYLGAIQPGFNGSSSSGATAYTGDDLLLKNYITAKAVYSNNPNLKALKDGEEAYDKTSKPEGVKLYLDTSKDPGALQNPVGVAKESSANIVTYRLRVHATTEDIKDKSDGGVEGVYFAIKNEKGQYAKVRKINSTAISSYDEVDGEKFYTDAGTLGSSAGNVFLYVVDEWTDVSGAGVTVTDTDYVMQTNSVQTSSYKIQKETFNSGRFEIIGLAPSTYTVVALEKEIKAREDITKSGDYKEYSISKEGGKPKTEYSFSFAPTLSETCTKLLYNTHYAPNNFKLSSLHGSYFNSNGEYNSSTADKHSVNTTGLITNYNMKWYDMQGNEIAKEKADWWLGQRNDVALMSMRVTYIKKGLSLPVTGGIGTFIFFAVGGALVVISTVAIVTKFRIKREQL